MICITRINTTSDRKGRDREENSMGIILVIYTSLPDQISYKEKKIRETLRIFSKYQANLFSKKEDNTIVTNWIKDTL